MSPVQSIPPTVTIASPPNSSNATGYYNYNNNNNNNNHNKYRIGETTATTTINRTQRPRKVMSDALSISNITQKQMAYEPPPTHAGGVVGSSSGSAVSVEQSAVAAVAAAAAYQFNYSHLYADRAALAATMYGHGPPIMFSGPPAHPMFTVSTPVPAHAYKLNNNDNSVSGGGGATLTDSNTVFTSAYLKAIQNAVTASIFNPTQMTSQLQPQQQQQQQSTPTSQILTPPTPTLPKSPTLLAASMSSLAVSCAATSPTIPSAHNSGNNNNNNSNNNKTYLNEKSINAKNMGNSTTADVNYFKVPSGKEGSLKHRILTRPQNAHVQNLSILTEAAAAAAAAAATTTTTTTNNFNKSFSNCNSNAIMRTYDSTSNFRRGSYIELSNGVLRKVEDMRTEDFIQCAERSPQHKLAESTVVKIDLTPANTVIITFSYDNNRSRADVEVSHDHPFFVYGQGWASYNPDASANVFGLKCQRLQVGDICISLTIRDADANDFTVPPQQLSLTPTPTTTPPPHMPVTPTAMNMTMSAVPPAEYSRYQMPATDQYVNTNLLPLSPHTPPAALVTSNNHLSMPPTHYAVTPGGLPYHLLPPHLTASLVGTTHPYTSAEMADLVSAYAYHAHLASTAPPPPPPPPSPQTKVHGNLHYYHNHHHQQQPQSAHLYHSEGSNMSKDSNNKIYGSQDVIDFKHYVARYDGLAPPVSSHSQHAYTTDGSHFFTHAHNHNHHQNHQHNHHQMHQPQQNHQQPQQEEPVDATIARKRRWSAPEGVCDDDDDIKHQPVRLSSVSSSTSSSSSSIQHYNNNNNHSSNSSSISGNGGSSMYKIFKPAPVVAAAPPL